VVPRTYFLNLSFVNDRSTNLVEICGCVQVLSVSVLSLCRRAASWSAAAELTTARRRRSWTSSTTPWRRHGPAVVCTTCCRAVPVSCQRRSDCFIQSRGSAACTRYSISVSSPCSVTFDSISSTGCRYRRVSRSTSSMAVPLPPTPGDHDIRQPVTVYFAARRGPACPASTTSLSRLVL